MTELWLEGEVGGSNFPDGWNETEQGNTSAEMIAAVNTSGNYVFNASTAGTCNEAGLLDSYDSAYFYGLNKTMNNATTFKDNDKLLFGTGNDVAMYFNGTHFVIEST